MVPKQVLDDILAAKPYSAVDGLASRADFAKAMPALGYSEAGSSGGWHFYSRADSGVAVNYNSRGVNYLFMSKPDSPHNLQELVQNAEIIGPFAMLDKTEYISRFQSGLGNNILYAGLILPSAAFLAANYLLKWNLDGGKIGLLTGVSALIGFAVGAVTANPLQKLLFNYQKFSTKRRLSRLKHPQNYLYGINAASVISEELKEAAVTGS